MLEQLLNQAQFSKQDIVTLLSLHKECDLAKLYQKAKSVKQTYVGNDVYYRGLIEFGNRCEKNCYYCGIRAGNDTVERYQMETDDIVNAAVWAYKSRYGSITLQSGELSNDNFIKFCEDTLYQISAQTNQELGITLCMGEQTKETYERWYKAGGTRYLLRIETTNPELYHKIHPKDKKHSYERRIECLTHLQQIGYQVGTGVMIGLPGQTYEDLADDILFFKKKSIDMIGMGPYVFHQHTPMGQTLQDTAFKELHSEAWRMRVSLNMIAVARIVLKDVNIAATTALQALDPLGREKGLDVGANVLMPIITEEQHRKKYQLYENKPCINDSAEDCKICLLSRVESVKNRVAYGQKGDSLHFEKRKR